MTELIRPDCRHFCGDVPCGPNKARGVTCGECDEFRPWGPRVLIVKLDALGDVLRTTCIVEPIFRQWPGARLTWITAPSAVPLFDNLSEIAEVVPSDHQATAMLAVEEFDVILGLDAGAQSARLTAMARGGLKRGYAMDPRGVVQPLNPGATTWYEMGLFDEVKKRNRRTYQHLICEACQLPGPPGHLLYQPTAAERDRARRRAIEWGLEGRAPVLGFNVGAGTRWPAKRWPLAYWDDLVAIVRAQHPAAAVLLLGGAEEKDALEVLASRHAGPRVVHTGHDNSLRDFAAVVELCDLVVTADTLALHLATALRKHVVSFFGPTSADEIDLDGLGRKLKPEAGCDCYYQRTCGRDVPCLDGVTPAVVYAAITELLFPVSNDESTIRGGASGDRTDL